MTRLSPQAVISALEALLEKHVRCPSYN